MTHVQSNEVGETLARIGIDEDFKAPNFANPQTKDHQFDNMLIVPIGYMYPAWLWTIEALTVM